MKEYILNTIVLKTGDSIEIVEPSTLPMKDRVMYKLQHEEDRVVIVRGNGKMVIPMDNIMFSSSIPSTEHILYYCLWDSLWYFLFIE